MSASPRRNRRSRRLGDRPVAAFTLAFTALLAAAGLSFGALSAAGVPLLGDITIAKPVVNAQPKLDLADTPAEKVTNAVLNETRAGWVAAAATSRPAPFPYPFTCNPAGGAPALSVGRHFDIPGASVDVVIASYTAGLGAEAAKALRESVTDCSSGHASVSDLAAPGVQAWSVTSDRSNPTVMFRRGDVLVFVTSPQLPDTVGAASAIDSSVNAALAPVCAVQDASTVDAARNRWSQAGYRAYTTAQTVTVPAASLPTVPKTATYKTTTLPAPTLQVPAVSPAPNPDYPVWPLMPAVVAAPSVPKAPTSTASNTTTIQVLTNDTTGPGCGWAFTGMKAPRFDLKTAKTANDKLVTAAKKQLNDAGKKWQKDVLAYWQAYDVAVKALPAYQAYAEQVATVNTAWAQIGAQWASYRTDHDAWQKRQNTYAALQQQKQHAQAQYEAALNTCMGVGTTTPPTSTPTPSPTGTPDPTATPTPSPTATAPPAPVKKKTLAECTAEVQKPEVLNTAYPWVGPEPQPPADPRPAGSK